tara:strand:- start:420 stop:590 length:171 start_codon:yes stop_codon:yes gene_type:complete
MTIKVNYTAPKIIYREIKKDENSKSKIEKKCDLLERKCRVLSNLIKKTNLDLEKVN